MIPFLDKVKKKGNKNKELDKDSILWIHHKLMKHYGWIPLEEFKEIPTKNVIGLLNECMKEENCELNKIIALLKTIGNKKAEELIERFVNNYGND